MYLDSLSFAHFFEFFTCIGNVGNNCGGLVFGFVCWVVCCWGYWRGCWCVVVTG